MPLYAYSVTADRSKTGFLLHYLFDFSFSFCLFVHFLMKCCITKTYLYNFDPLKPHFYIAKLGFIGFALFFYFCLKNIDCGYSIEPPRRGGSNVYPKSMFWAEIGKISDFLSEKIAIFDGKIFNIFEKACFRNVYYVAISSNYIFIRCL